MSTTLSAWLFRMGLGLGLLLLAGLVWIYLRQERLIFFPEALPAEHHYDFGADVKELRLPVAGGAELSALHLKLDEPKGLVFYLHGNGGNLQGWFANADFYRRAGYDLFMLDYRGYGKSGGRIESEAQLRADVRTAWDLVSPQYAGKRRIIIGRSLGTALAAGLAAEVRPEQLILVSPFTRMVELMRLHFPLLPTPLLRYPLDTAGSLQAWQGPLLLIHGDRDELIPPAQSESLQAGQPQSRLVRIPGAGHNDLQAFPRYLEAVREVLP
ncbi:alpha/beta fold hydrolase [Pelomonas sp. SE-A7]|uniref:alpha/beta hydrolase n=1 Tax=Pelomonas sp. SE-A7 TaxID=3054953 RepID=UPI00259D1699|nr:alpha/beta fold hydrolase [Pelomonas sp. SE-A7]MDM4767950.1 alpha/beta fold hydrolase [Pelomonas sp. SE-A7]